MSDTQMITVGDRDIEIQKLNETQMMILVREAHVIKSSRSDINRKLLAIATMLNVVETAVIDEDDRLFLMEQAGLGKVSFGEMLKIASPDQAVDGEVVPVKAVRRGRIAR